MHGRAITFGQSNNGWMSLKGGMVDLSLLDDPKWDQMRIRDDLLDGGELSRQGSL